MLKTTLLLLSCVAVLPLHADPIDQFEAKRIAAQFLSQPKLQHEQVETRSGAMHTPAAYYLFNDADNKGFVIISGEDRLNPLVGYSDNAVANTQQMPEPLKDFLLAYEQVVAEVRSGSITPSTPVLTTKSKVAPLLTSNWGQGLPYNRFSPFDKGRRTPSGCVATGMAQVMNYYKWPLNRPQTHPEAADQLAQQQDTYLWGEMTDLYSANDYGMSASAVATLIRDIGDKVRMNYGASESFAHLSLAVLAFEKEFGYTTTHLFKDYMPAGEFQRYIMQELASGHPVFVGGGRHAFVYDGYDEKGLIHTNWGWDGVYDGYFDINTISLAKVGTGGGNGQYWRGQEAIIVRPNNGQYDTTEQRPRRLALYRDMGLSFAQTETPRNTPAVANLTGLCTSNRIKEHLGAFTGLVGLGVYNAAGQRVAIIEHPGGNLSVETHYNYQELTGWNVDFSALAEGEYTLKPLSKALLEAPSTYAEWLEIEGGNTVGISVARDKVVIKQSNDGLHLNLAKSPELLAPLYVSNKNNGAVALSVSNATRIERRGIMMLHFKGIGHTFDYTAQASEKTFVAERMGVTNMIVPIPTSYQKDGVKTILPEGRYEVSFAMLCQDEYGSPLTVDIKTDNACEIEVLPTSDKSIVYIRGVDFLENGQSTELQVFDMQKAASIGFKVHSDVRGTASSSDYTGKLYYRLKDLADGTLIDIGNTASVTLSKGLDSNIDQTLIEFSPTLLQIGHVYEVHVEIEDNGKRIDVWNNHSPRRVLSIVDENPITTITPHPTNTTATAVVYNLQGMRIQTPFDQLPRGIYIVNGKTVTKP